jgi:urease subunit gamma/beta
MRLTPREQERLFVHCAGELAKSRKSRGLKLNYPESIAYLTSELLELARDGLSVTELMSEGKKLLKSNEVLPGVAEMIHELQFEATFPDGTKLVTVHEPIIPTGELIPGEFIFDGEELEINAGKPTLQLDVTNRADRPIQVGSHFHFFETNKSLDFDRKAAFGMRLDIPSGTASRFEPGETRSVTLVAIGGKRLGYGLNCLVNGAMDDSEVSAKALAKAKELGYLGA